jgi:Patatin-like phospholipase
MIDWTAIKARFQAALTVVFQPKPDTLGNRRRCRADRRPPPDAPLPAVQCLAVLGGGENGAFSEGVLRGWFEQGTRPEFDLVTGVSTGALITEPTPSHVLLRRYLTAAVFDDAMADNSPLYETIFRYLNKEIPAAAVKSYEDGRLFLIPSTDLNSQQPVI